MVEVGEPWLEGRATLCVPWQLLQPGAKESPPAALRPWTLAPYWFCSSVWQWPHRTGASF
jgi:hypothetical protein